MRAIVVSEEGSDRPVIKLMEGDRCLATINARLSGRGHEVQIESPLYGSQHTIYPDDGDCSEDFRCGADISIELHKI